MVVTIRKTEDGYSWQPFNGRAYSIQLEQIFPSRIRDTINKALATNPKLALTYRYYLYTKDKILFLSNEKIV